MNKVWEVLYCEVRAESAGPFLFLQKRLVETYNALDGVRLWFEPDRDDPANWTVTFEYENMKAYLAATERRNVEQDLSVLWSEFGSMLSRPASRKTHFESTIAA